MRKLSKEEILGEKRKWRNKNSRVNLLRLFWVKKYFQDRARLSLSLARRFRLMPASAASSTR